MNTNDIQVSTLDDPVWYAWTEGPRQKPEHRTLHRALVLSKTTAKELGVKTTFAPVRVLLLSEDEQEDGKPGRELDTYGIHIISRWETVENQVRAAQRQDFLLQYAREQLARERRDLEQAVRESGYDLVKDFRFEDGVDRVSVPYHIVRALLKGKGK